MMICRNCGSEHNNPQFCPVCNIVYSTDRTSDVQKYIDSSLTVLILSIIAIALATNVPIPGIVLSAIAGSKINNLPFVREEELASEMLEKYNSAKNKVRIARILQKIALPVSIVFLALTVFISFIYYFIMILAEF